MNAKFVLNDKIDTIPTVKFYALINDRDRFLTFKNETLIFHFRCQTFLIRTLKQSRAECLVH